MRLSLGLPGQAQAGYLLLFARWATYSELCTLRTA